ncbi:Lecithin:cholesterol acyltransferase [Salipiger thiooxidans]|uniref:Lecithin:cholesterol acyltransferase n=1 Tax=Salipiger thiooxidans TaxID=282683 RepID=A0A1G7DQ41_9RHOB|nr:hypothetical protein [Salipiger thiooxidans]SDE53644.1 Lecithin:cholesterol acyltransferase [Salipiger thiooxidans]
MKTTVVFLPGIMGSELVLPDGEVVWPPKVTETVFGYKRIEKLQSPNLRVTRVIGNVSCVDFYNRIQALFKELEVRASGGMVLVEHPYDWRLDLFDLAEGLAAKLDTLESDDFVIVAHSMGGLVTRLMLETPTYRARPWFGKVRAFYALATPHNGAPLALARVLGLDSALGISGKDFKMLAENTNYPSGYQLLPAPGEDACWNTTNGADLAPYDFYDNAIATKLGMSPALVARAKAVHDAFADGEAPEHVRYFYFSGAGHKTVTRVNVDGAQARVVTTPDAGDGTVPMWSSLPRRVQKQVVVNDHAGVFRGDPFKRVFFRLFGQDAGDPREMGAEVAPTVALTLQKPIFGQGEAVEVVLASDDPFKTLAGALVFEALTEDDAVDAEVARVPVSYAGPEIATLAMSVTTQLPRGFYELRFEGSHVQADRVVFAVAQRSQ